MSLNRWKVLACTLTIGVGGLAVFATPPAAPRPDQVKEPAPLPELTVKPASPANGTDTPAPIKPVKAEEFELVVPVPVVPPAPMTGKKPASEPVFEPVEARPLVIPAGGTDVVPPVKPEAEKTEPKPAPSKPLDLDLDVPPVKDPPKPEAPKPADKTPELDVDIPPVSKPVPPVAPLAPPAPMPSVPPLVPMEPPVAPSSPVPPLPAYTPTPVPPTSPMPPPMGEQGHPPGAAKLRMLLRMGDGQPRFEIRNAATSELLLKVYAEKIEMQAPPDSKSSLAGVSATGRVRFTAPGIEGTCEHLTILSATGEVLLKDRIHLKAKYGRSWSEMTAEKMVYQIGTSGLSSPGTRPAVTPASYIPD